MKETSRTTSRGTFTIRKLDAPQDFHCDHCNKDKKSRNIAEFTPVEGKKQTLCNGCHGELLTT